MSFNVAIYSFTNRGNELAAKIANYEMSFRGREVLFRKMNTFEPIHFEQFDGLIFIGALGIAVRKIATCVKSKMTDPAVIVIDENANNVISVLSGHIGGANEMTKLMAEKLNSNAVITTATDVNNLPAIDEVAANNGFICSNKDGIVKINKKILDGEKVSISAEESVEIVNLSDCFYVEEYYLESKENKKDIIISSNIRDIERCILHILNKNVILGVGCRKDIDVELFETTVLKAIEGVVTISDIMQISSIDLKKNEKALTVFSEKYGIPLVTYSSDDLSKMTGDFEESEFVLKTTGVSNVSERAAAYDKSGTVNGEFIIKQIKESGITLSLFKRNRRFDFNG